jgi:hypothetical protein
MEILDHRYRSQLVHADGPALMGEGHDTAGDRRVPGAGDGKQACRTGNRRLS